MSTTAKYYLILLFGASLLSSLNWGQVNGFMPPWLLLVGLYMIYRSPLKLGLGFTFLLGLYSDILNFQLIGIDTLLFCLSAWIVRLFCWSINAADKTSMTLSLSIIAGFYVLINFVAQVILGELMIAHFNALEFFVTLIFSAGVLLVLSYFDRNPN